MFGWLRNRRRRRILAQPFPAEWEAVLRSNVWQYETLSDAEQAKLRDDLRIFIAEKNWEGCGGLEMTDEVKVTVAAYACLIVLGLSLGLDSYDRVLSILVYPDEFYVRDTTVTREGFHRDELADHLGEAWHRGPVILSWADTLDSGRRRGAGTNVVIHEFAHQLDMLNASVDGMPPLRTTAQIRQWRHVIPPNTTCSSASPNRAIRPSSTNTPPRTSANSSRSRPSTSSNNPSSSAAGTTPSTPSSTSTTARTPRRARTEKRDPAAETDLV